MATTVGFDFVTFHVWRKSHHFSCALSHSVLKEVKKILFTETRGIKVFVHRGAAFREFLHEKFA